MAKPETMTLYRVDWTRINTGQPETASKLYRLERAAQQLADRLTRRGYLPTITIWTATRT